MWTDEVYEGRSWEGERLEEVEMRNCRFVQCSLRGARMAETTTSSCEFDECDFTNAALNATVHTNSSFLNCDLTNADLFNAALLRCRMVGSVFEGTDLRTIRVEGGDCSFATLR